MTPAMVVDRTVHLINASKDGTVEEVDLKTLEQNDISGLGTFLRKYVKSDISTSRDWNLFIRLFDVASCVTFFVNYLLSMLLNPTLTYPDTKILALCIEILF